MKTLVKRLTVLNDGFAVSNVPARDRMDAVINRYVAKMQKKGWTPNFGVTAGNAFKYWEAYVRLGKVAPALADETAADAGFCKNSDGFYAL